VILVPEVGSNISEALGLAKTWGFRLASPTIISKGDNFIGVRVILLDENRNEVSASFNDDRTLAGRRAPQTILLDEPNTVCIVRISKST
jgi:hypothetical protein